MKRKTVITCAVTAVVCVLAILLPDLVLGIHDRAVASRVESLEVDEVALDFLSVLTPTQKLYLAGDRSATVIPLASGRKMDALTAQKHIYELVPIGEEVRVLSAGASLKVASDGSTMILWRVAIQDGSDWVYTLVFDDDTGYLLGMELDVPQAYLDKYGWDGPIALPDAAEGYDPGWLDLRLMCSGFSDLILPSFGLTLDYIETMAPGAYYLHLSDGYELYAEATNVDGIHMSLNT